MFDWAKADPATKTTAIALVRNLQSGIAYKA
jgi:hypothetical protein